MGDVKCREAAWPVGGRAAPLSGHCQRRSPRLAAEETPAGRPRALGRRCRTGPGHWPLTREVGGPAPCCSSAASRVSAKGNAFSPLSKDSSLGISRLAGVGEHPHHEGLLPSCAQAGITNRAGWSLVTLPCGAPGGSSHEMGLVCRPSEPLALAQLPAPFGQVICKGGWGAGPAVTAALSGQMEES